jgi:signal transduction histidine kinase
MVEPHSFRRQKIMLILLVAPLAAFLFLRLVPAWDWLVWDTIWYAQLIYFYTTALISFMALIAGVFVNAALKTTRTRTMFTRLAFAAQALFFLLTSITTPSTLFSGISSEPMCLVSRLALLLSAVFFALAVVRWNIKWQDKLFNGRFLFWLTILTLFAIVGWEIYSNWEIFDQISRYAPQFRYAAAVITIILYLFAGRRSLQLHKKGNNPFEKAFAVTLFLLAEAQISQTLGVWGHLSWLLHSLIILVALTISLFAFLRACKSLRDLQPARYFAVLGSISIMTLALVSGELIRLLVTGVNRRFIVGLTLTQSAISFAIMYVIVLNLDRLIKERTEALKREQKLRNELTRLIVHDLKNPLMIMTQGADLLSRSRLGDLTPEQKKLSDRIQQAGEKTIHLIDDILTVEKMETDVVLLQHTPVDLWGLLSETVASLQILANSNHQTLTLHLSSRLPIIQADESLLRRVMDNIIVNALKFTPDNGRVTVTATSDGSHLMIEVADSGPGVPPTYRDQIFEKFSQVHTTERRGVGLGLTFCKMVVDAHHGTIVVEDSDLGGALFKISLPLHTEVLITEPSNTQPPKNKLRIIKPSFYTTIISRL